MTWTWTQRPKEKIKFDTNAYTPPSSFCSRTPQKHKRTLEKLPFRCRINVYGIKFIHNLLRCFTWTIEKFVIRSICWLKIRQAVRQKTTTQTIDIDLIILQGGMCEPIACAIVSLLLHIFATGGMRAILSLSLTHTLSYCLSLYSVYDVTLYSGIFWIFGHVPNGLRQFTQSRTSKNTRAHVSLVDEKSIFLQNRLRNVYLQNDN